MKTVTERPSFQGDVCIYRVAEIPARAVAAIPEDGHYIVTHSETGHHHVVAERSAQMLIDETNTFIGWLRVLEPTELRHLRDRDTHEPYMLEPGCYEFRRQREATSEGFWRKAQD